MPNVSNFFNFAKKMSLKEFFLKRRSIRAFGEKQITAEQINMLFDTCKWAPSSYNEQPWMYYYAFKENSTAFEKFIDCLVDANQKWAKNAQVMMMSVGRIINSQTNKENKYFMHDVGAANAYLCLEAAALGFQAHQMAGFDTNKAIETFQLDKSLYFPVTFIAIGYAADLETLPENVRIAETSPRKRKENSLFTKEIAD